MPSVNKAILIGHLGRDPEVRYKEDMTIVNFTMATSKKRQGESKTTWHRCVAFKQTADVIVKYCAKGDPIYIEGEIDNYEYEKDGEKRYGSSIIVNNVQLLKPRDQRQTSRSPAPSSKQTSMAGMGEEFDDDIPF